MDIPLSRRSFLSSSLAGPAAVAGTFMILRPELVRGAGDEMVKAGVVGCGGRGTQAAIDFMTGNSNVQVVAVGDLFEDQLEASLAKMRGKSDVAEKVKVDPEHHFVGFDAYQKVLASDIDLVILATPPGYRPMHIEAAVAAGKHIFAEKPFGTDPVGVKRVMASAQKAKELKLTLMSGAQRHAQKEYVETIDQIHHGKIGDVVATYAYWEGTPVIPKKPRDPQWADMTWQHRGWYSYVWICGDQIVEQHLHNIDVINWVMGGHPVSCAASGGAAWRPREEIYGNIYDHIGAEFTYANGVKLSSYCRQYPKGSYQNVSELVVGTKGKSNCKDMGAPGLNPYVQEHIDLVKSIRGQGPYINHGQMVAESTMTCIMGREAAYSGQEITWDQMMASQLDLQPKDFGYDKVLPPTPLPVPGVYKFA